MHIPLTCPEFFCKSISDLKSSLTCIIYTLDLIIRPFFFLLTSPLLLSLDFIQFKGSKGEADELRRLLSNPLFRVRKL